MAKSTTEPPPTESEAVKKDLQTFILVMYIMLIVVSVLANIFMLLALWRKFQRHRRTAKSFIILMQNLGVSGLVLVITSIPFDLELQESDTWPFGVGGCKILWPLQTVALQAMVYTYVALACHRLCGVINDLFGQMKFISAVVITFVIWITGILTVLPYVVNLRYDHENHTCEEEWSSNFGRNTYTLSLFLLDYLFPLIAIILFFLLVRGKMQSFRILDPERACRRDRHYRVMRMMLAYIIVFAICLLPHQIMWLIKDFGDGEKKLYFAETLNVLYIFTYSATIINPIMFFVYNPEFRRHLCHFLKCQCITKKKMFSVENLSQSFSEEPGPRPPKYPSKPQYELKQFEPKPLENNYNSTPTMVHADSGLGLVEAGMFPSAVGRFRVQEKHRESSPSASPPPSEMLDYNDAPGGSFDQGFSLPRSIVTSSRIPSPRQEECVTSWNSVCVGD